MCPAPFPRRSVEVFLGQLFRAHVVLRWLQFRQTRANTFRLLSGQQTKQLILMVFAMALIVTLGVAPIAPHAWLGVPHTDRLPRLLPGISTRSTCTIQGLRRP